MVQRRHGRDENDGEPDGEAGLGAEAFGRGRRGGPTGAEAFGGPDADDPLRGALLFGNDPQGAPRGSEAIGGSEPDVPLKGALLFGNAPDGAPRGSEAIGGSEPSVPLKGALLFGNDPGGALRGSEAMGGACERFRFRGAEAFGASQLIPRRLDKDRMGYDFAATLIVADEGSLAGMRKDPRNRVRQRLLGVLARALGLEPERLRHGLGEEAIPWGRLRRERSLDRALAELLRAAWRKAPGGVLGIGHVQELLEANERMHTFALGCEWDVTPVALEVVWHDAPVARGVSVLHRRHRYFIFRDPKGVTLAFVDAIAPESAAQVTRVRSPHGETVARFEIAPSSASDPRAVGGHRPLGVVRDRSGAVALRIVEERVAAQAFRALLLHPDADEPLGLVEDARQGGKIRTQIELDLAMPRVVAWGLAAVLADLARLRRSGWPKVPLEPEPAPIESVRDALGPRRR